jgi:hypothetical protein
MAERFFAYCEHKGCKARKPFLAPVVAGAPVIRTDNGLENLFNAAYFRPAGIEAPMRRRGIWCDAHGPMRVEPLNATYNPEKVCDGRCTNARRGSCDCSCRGENHGSAA